MDKKVSDLPLLRFAWGEIKSEYLIAGMEEKVEEREDALRLKRRLKKLSMKGVRSNQNHNLSS